MLIAVSKSAEASDEREEDRNEAFKCGMNAFVSKPAVICEILNVLKEIIG